MCEYISSYGQRRNIFFLKTAHLYGLNFLDNYLFIRSKNLKTSLKIWPETSKIKGIKFCCVQMIHRPFDS